MAMRHVLHVLVSIAMWCLFGYYWQVVLGREIGSGTVRALIILGLTVVLGLLLTMIWVAHNLRLARKFAGRRQAPREVGPPPMEQDTIGRVLQHPGLNNLRNAQVVEIDADEDSKSYTVVGEKVSS